MLGFVARIILYSSLYIFMNLSLNMAVQLTSHSFPIYNNDLEASIEKPWAFVVYSSKLFIGRFVV